ncbi:MAG: hypothetical protein IT361_02050 [Gemmatimonadaceae bacterium]|nr:hypothetical protein [Gemmatimonadaceae bacterium]
MALSPKDYDVLEGAVARGGRLAITRNGSQWIVVARQLVVERGREALLARHPSTGEAMRFLVDDIERIEGIW